MTYEPIRPRAFRFSTCPIRKLYRNSASCFLPRRSSSHTSVLTEVISYVVRKANMKKTSDSSMELQTLRASRARVSSVTKTFTECERAPQPQNLPPCGGDVAVGDRGGDAADTGPGSIPPSALSGISPARGEIGRLKRCESGHKLPPSPEQSQPLTQNPPHFHPHLPPPCHTVSAPVAGWIANVSDQAGGRPLGIWRNVREIVEGGGGHRGSAGGRSKRPCKASHRAGSRFRMSQQRQETEAPVRACGGHDGPSAARQGPCRTPRTTSAVSPDRGRSNPGGRNTPGV